MPALLRPALAAACAFAAALSLAAQQEGRPSEGPVEAAGPAPSLLALEGRHPQRRHLRQHPRVVDAIDAALEWLCARQDDDGRWDADAFLLPGDAGDAVDVGPGKPTHDVAVTGLVTLAIAREGRPERGDRDHRAMVRAAHWLAVQQGADGLLGARISHDFVYDHAIGTLGLLAAAAATGSGEARTAGQRAIAYLEAHRNPYAVWRYQARDGDNDTSVTTWCTLACAVGRDIGLEVEPRLFTEVGGWIAAVTDAGGRTGYTKAGEPSSRIAGRVHAFPPDRCETLTGAGLLCRVALGQGLASPGHSTALLLAKPPSWDPDAGRVDYCYWFFASEALRHADAAVTAAWRKALIAALVDHQRREGALAGSWDPVDPWGEEGGRLCATALAVLALQSLYAPVRG